MSEPRQRHNHESELPSHPSQEHLFGIHCLQTACESVRISEHLQLMKDELRMLLADFLFFQVEGIDMVFVDSLFESAKLIPVYARHCETLSLFQKQCGRKWRLPNVV